MALTTAKIKECGDQIDIVTKALIISLIRQNDLYRINAAIFSGDLSSRIDATNGTVKAQMLNALMFEIDELDTGQVEIRGDKDALWWSQNKERQALVREMLNVLFDEAAEGTMLILENGDIITGGSTTGVMPSAGNYGVASTGQRPYFSYVCGTCRSSYNSAVSCCGVTAVMITTSNPLSIFYR